MHAFGNHVRTKLTTVNSLRAKFHCSGCRPSPCGCGGPGRSSGQRPTPPPKCKPSRIAPNPCVPRFHEGKDTWKKYRFITIFICFPLIFAQAFNALSHSPPHKQPCRDFEYMRIRTKRFPWGNGNETFFHNEHVNHLPGECEPPPLDCD